MTLAPTPEVKAAVETVEAAKDWLAGEVTRRRNASGRAVKIQGVVGHEAAANHLSTILTALSQATEENERLRDECCKLADTGLTQAQRATKAEAETDEALEALSTLLERCRAHGGLSRQGYAERKAMADAAALLSRSAQGRENVDRAANQKTGEA